MQHAVPIATPPGFEPYQDASPFLERIGPVFQRRDGDVLTLAIPIQPYHCNRRGLVHGGVFATLADITLGKTLHWSEQGGKPLVTAGMTLDYIGSVKVGDLLEARCDYHRVGGRLATANCYLTVGGEVVGRANATFAVLPAG